jgi:hypothetical protein
MKTFTIDKETYNITLHSAIDDATAIANAERFRNEAELAKLAGDWPGARLIEIWNSLPEVTPVKKFKDRATAVSRIWRALQSLGEQPETVVARTPEPTLGTTPTPQMPNVGRNEAPAKAKANLTAEPPKRAKTKRTRESGKTEAILALMKQPSGTTLKTIMEATNWQAHAVRGFISGTLGKKMGLTVVSVKDENGDRRYTLPS